MVKKILKSVREYKKASILTPIFVSIEVLFEILIPFVLASLIDKGIDASNMSEIIRIGFILIIMSILSLVCGYLSGKYCAIASSGFGKNLRKDLFYKMQDFTFSNIDKFSQASLITRLTIDVTRLQNSYNMIIRIAVRAPLMMIFAFIMSCKINMKLASIFIFTIPLLALGLFLILKTVHPLFEQTFKEYDKLNNVVEENLNGIRVVKSFVAEEKEIKKFNKVSKKIYSLFSKGERIVSLNNPLMEFCVYSSMLLISWIGARLIVNGNLTTGQLMSMITYVMQILMSLMMVSMIFIMVVISTSSLERVCEVLDEKIDIENPKKPIYEIKNGLIEFKNVSFSYVNNNEKLCLENINLKIKSGSTVGIIGSTGCGKTTLVQLIPRLYDVTKGELLIGGINVKKYDLYNLRDSVSMVLQKNVLFKGTLLENLKWGNKNATLEEVKQSCKLACIDDFIETLKDKYDSIVEQGGSNFSGGQRQRICIARALLKKPKILILDDSTSAVDTKTDKLIRKSFKESIPNTTKIIISQRISSIMFSDLIIVMDNGKIDDYGTHKQLLKRNKIYKEVYTSQIEGGVIDE